MSNDLTAGYVIDGWILIYDALGIWISIDNHYLVFSPVD